MAIAFDAVASAALGTSPRSWSHTSTTGASLVVFPNHVGASTSVTYNGTALTQYGTDQPITDAYTIACYFLLAADSGTNTVTVTASSNVGGSSQSYTGVGSVDSTEQTGAAGNSPIEITLSSITASDCWIAAGYSDSRGNPVASTGLTQRAQWQGGTGSGDSGGTVGTGSQTIFATYSPTTGNSGYVGIAMAPTGGGGGATFVPVPTLSLLGVG